MDLQSQLISSLTNLAELLLELPNEDNSVIIESNSSIINAHYVKIQNEELIVQEIYMNNPQFVYFEEENTEHVLIITSGYSGNESQKIGLNIALLEPIISGDINGDLEVNIVDIVQLVNHILESIQFTNAQLQIVDLNQDELVNIIDIVILVNLILNN